MAARNQAEADEIARKLFLMVVAGSVVFVALTFVLTAL